MELISTRICMASDVGVHGNLFGGIMLSWIDEAAGAMAAQICDTPLMVTIKMDEVHFKKPVRVGNVIKIYGELDLFGKTSISLKIQARKHNVYDGTQKVVCDTKIKFIRLDEDSEPAPISERAKTKYYNKKGISIPGEAKENKDGQEHKESNVQQ